MYAISDLVMYHLSRNDRKLHDHLEKIAEVNVEVTAKDFVIDLMKKVGYSLYGKHSCWAWLMERPKNLLLTSFTCCPVTWIFYNQNHWSITPF